MARSRASAEESGDGSEEERLSRLRRRRQFLEDLAEARALRGRVAPRRTRAARMRVDWWVRSYRR